MHAKWMIVAALAAVGTFAAAWRGVARSEKPSAEPQLAHMVFFTMKENTAANRQKLVDACKKYLAKHDGTAYFSAGSRCTDLNREVNDQEFDVALHLVFKDKAAHDKYQDAPLHLQFINENKDLWKKVRVFDSFVEP